MGDIYEQLDRRLYKLGGDAPSNFFGSTEVSPDQLAPGSFVASIAQNMGIIYNGKAEFSNAQPGYILGIDQGVAKFYIGDSTSYLNWDGTTFTISGSLTAASGSIGGFDIGADYIRDVANSMGLASTVTGGDDVRFWAGAAFASRATAPFRVTEAGAVTASNITITGGSIVTSILSGTISQGNLNVADRGWTQTSAFTVTDADTVAWGSGTFTSADGTAYSISGSNTGNMSAKTYIYLDTAVSTTAYQVTTTPTTAVGAGKVLIAIAQNATGEATFQVMQGQGGQNIDAANIVAGSITANEIAASTITAGKMSVSTLSSMAADLGTITAGTITLNSSGHIKSGQTDFNTGTGFWLGYTGGLTKFSIGNPSDEYMYWDGADLILNGYSLTTVVEGATADINFGLFRGHAEDALTEVVSNATITRNILTTDVAFSTGSTGWSLASGVFGEVSNSADFDWTHDYEFFTRLKSDVGAAHTTLEGRSYFWGLVESGGGLPTFTSAPLSKGKIIDVSHVGFIVDFDDNIFATSGTGAVTTASKILSGQDVTELGITHTDFNNYKIVTHYAALGSVSNTGFIRPTAHSDPGSNWTNEANAYDTNTTTYTNSTTDANACNYVVLSWDGGTTWTQAMPTGIDGTKTAHTLGGSTDTWGRTWTAANLSNANFIVRFFTGTAYDDGITATAIQFSTFGFSTGSMVDITGIELEFTAETENPGSGTQAYIYDIRAKIYYTTAASTGYVKFYVNDTLVATHTASMPRGTENPIIKFAGHQGLNVASGKQIFFNNYRVKAIT